LIFPLQFHFKSLQLGILYWIFLCNISK
jgi:hypothetical protein